MSLSINTSPLGPQRLSTSQIMAWVIIACVPGLVALTLFFGWGSLLNIIWLSLLALAFEALVLKCRGRNIGLYLKDYSALVTAILLGLSLPPGVPWWLGVVGIGFAILIGKHLYGGLGFNPFNPAMVAYVVLLISFPQEMTRWIMPNGLDNNLPSFTDSFHALFSSGAIDNINNIDAFTGASAMEAFKLERGALMVSEYWQQNPLFGSMSGLGWEWVNVSFLLGGLFLFSKKIISWQIPAAMLLTITLLAAIFYDGGSSNSHGSPMMHLFGGATMLGAFFIATDPVTAATTPVGKLIYGSLVGALVYIIRVWSNYPEGMAFAVLLGNFAAPLIDHFTQPRTFGH